MSYALSSFVCLAVLVAAGREPISTMDNSMGYEIAAYYFPNYHVDPQNESVHGPGWTEWELVKHALPRFPGHRQPRVPVWGYEDEADPAVMAKKIDAAADHGIDVFLYDWYWYEQGPFLQRCLEQGFLQAPNNERMKFAIHWANHTWLDIQPAKLSKHPFADATVLYPGLVKIETFEAMTDYVIATYFHHSSYWKIDGCPYFSIYDLSDLIKSFGGVAKTKLALDRFREKVKAAGFPDLHLNVVLWSVKIPEGEPDIASRDQLLKTLGFNSIDSYVWMHHVALETFPETPYASVMKKAVAHWNETVEQFTLPYHPNVTMGWDSSPRTVQSDVFINAGYPFTPTLSGNTPAAFREALVEVKTFLDARPALPKVFTINAWNEWTEGSYLEPDTIYGMGYLDAITDVFSAATKP